MHLGLRETKQELLFRGFERETIVTDEGRDIIEKVRDSIASPEKMGNQLYRIRVLAVNTSFWNSWYKVTDDGISLERITYNLVL